MALRFNQTAWAVPGTTATITTTAADIIDLWPASFTTNVNTQYYTYDLNTNMGYTRQDFSQQRFENLWAAAGDKFVSA